MNDEQLHIMAHGKGFIAALDQSGGSTPKALKAYGVDESAYGNDQQMFDLVHAMRSRIVTDPAFDGHRVLPPSCLKTRWTAASKVKTVPTTCGTPGTWCRF